MPTDAVRTEGLTRRYGDVTALSEVDVAFAAGTFSAVMGPSGSGKSTLLQTAAGLDRPTAGRVWVGGTELTGLSETARTVLRRTRIGFVFQSFNLLDALSVEDNIRLPLRLSGQRPDEARIRAVVDRIGLTPLLAKRPATLSGGQQQRVALARALAPAPDVVFCDEPTGALDSRTAAGVLGLLRAAVDDTGATVVMVTHDPVAASYADRVLVLADGRVVSDQPRPGVARIAEQLAGAGVAR
jgi:putative ABC transport system ATP-binding protein